jgi:hypothetical protein
MLSLALLSLFAAPSSADIVASRTIDTVAAGNSGTIFLDKGCTDKDAYGSNNCDLKWNTNYTATINANLNQALYGNSTFTVDLKVDKIISFKFSCAVCGAPCTFTVPVVKKTVTLDLPDCPIPAGAFNSTQTFALPATSPVPVKTGAAGTVYANDPSGAVLAHASITASVE